MTPLRLVGQLILWALFLVPVGLFAHWPAWRPVPEGHGELKLSLAHRTARAGECRTLSEAERADLPPNMRAYEVCERGRVPALVEVLLGDRVLLREEVKPVGLHGDGRVYLFRAWPLPAGEYDLYINLRDTPRSEGFDKQQRFRLDLKPGFSALLKVGDGEAQLGDTAG